MRVVLFALLALALSTPSALAQSARAAANRNVIEVALGGSTILDLSGGGGRVTLTDPKIADVTGAGGGLLIIGRHVGETNLIMSNGNDNKSWLIKVTLPARAIQSELARIFPREDIEARAVGGSLVLVGVVNNTESVAQAEEVAIGYLKSPSIAALGVKPHVINLLRVRGRQQVQLEVKFAEVNRRSMREMGINFAGGSNDGRFGYAQGANGLSNVNPASQGDPHSTIIGRPAQFFMPTDGAYSSLFTGMRAGGFPFSATLNWLAVKDLARTLAEPTLVSMSGQTASFLAGGEFPYEKSTGFGNTTVEFKKFGIELSFTPTVLEEDIIHLKTKLSVSAPDPTVKIVSNGVLTEGFKRRASETSIRLRNAQSFAIAGLISDEMENLIEKVPFLGDVPVLGAIFSSKKFQRRETELVVVVTVRLVDPMNTDEMPPLPGWERVSDPTDVELFLLNFTEPSRRVPGGPSGSGGGAAATGPQPVGKLGFWR
ncbi:pilus assembly protein N-terminal domain-containing protein [Myxococcota bacterium]|nr:pilus assembly protein N-terminal domain-containing protein [Myxococcota bacterium]MBU1432936.1 pilus assembly protein N-terminal domain-containing protein [Myxococcota bacterium]MBU1896238.1 pilus assembly protein N-terminal domain-containing protein [Myxococcota bacterium]